MTTLDLDWMTECVGRSESVSDTITPKLVTLFNATFAPHVAPASPAETSLGIHWCLAPPSTPTRELDQDGHPMKGGFLPPVPLPRRMWAGGEIEIVEGLRIGDAVMRHSTIAGFRTTEGRSGPLCFVTVQHDISTERGVAIRERQDIVYREAAKTSSQKPAADPSGEPREDSSPDLAWTVDTSPTLLFRYSALTFNSHRIHYDMPYATEVEGYPGLVVHGPLQATLLLNLAATLHGRTPRRFGYRNVGPVFAGNPLRLAARRKGDNIVECWSATNRGTIGMKAEAEW